jgi:hypothetical protein
MTLAQTQRNPRGARIALTFCVALLLAALVGAGLPLGVAAAPTPKLNLSTRAMYFGYQALDSTSPAQTVTVKGRGNAAPLAISGVAVSGTSEYQITSDTCSGKTLSKKQSCTVGVAFRPTQIGARSASLVFTGSATTNNTVALSGYGAAPAVSLSTTALAFGDQKVNEASPAQTVTVVNSGTSDLLVTSAVLTGANGQFSLSANTCTNATVPPGGVCSVGVVFAPTSAGQKSASLTIADNAAGSPRTVSLGGTGVGGTVAAPVAKQVLETLLGGE